jgi:hypothetical protein
LVQKRKNKKAAIAAFVKYGTVTAACQAARIHRRPWYLWRKSDPEFDKMVESAREVVADYLEAEAIRRAYEGSNTLAALLLRGLMPEKYGKMLMIYWQCGATPSGIKIKRLFTHPRPVPVIRHCSVQ